jgi:hypothetical protein
MELLPNTLSGFTFIDKYIKKMRWGNSENIKMLNIGIVG